MSAAWKTAPSVAVRRGRHAARARHRLDGGEVRRSARRSASRPASKSLCVPTSEATRAQAERLGIPLTTLDEMPFLDLTVDGADEIDGELRLIKGGGGALLREKIVATASERMIVIADASKRSARSATFRCRSRSCASALPPRATWSRALAADAGCAGRDQAAPGRRRRSRS